jgi:hypothetical protein
LPERLEGCCAQNAPGVGKAVRWEKGSGVACSVCRVFPRFPSFSYTYFRSFTQKKILPVCRVRVLRSPGQERGWVGSPARPWPANLTISPTSGEDFGAAARRKTGTNQLGQEKHNLNTPGLTQIAQ